jgi:hypothetical protein
MKVLGPTLFGVSMGMCAALVLYEWIPVPIVMLLFGLLLSLLCLLWFVAAIEQAMAPKPRAPAVPLVGVPPSPRFSERRHRERRGHS